MERQENTEIKIKYKWNKDNDKTLRSGSNNDNAITGNISKKLLTFYIFIFFIFYIRLSRKCGSLNLSQP
jgi:hypothetical protein